jgi:plasmid maintenance system antidote protein VapI
MEIAVSDTEFQPDWASAPGETIQDLLDERGIDRPRFADMSGLSIPEVEALLHGRMEILEPLADRLETIFGVTRSFWLERDRQYREDLKRLAAAKAEKKYFVLCVNGDPTRVSEDLKELEDFEALMNENFKARKEALGPATISNRMSYEVLSSMKTTIICVKGL